jgi:hypothetical protein
LLTGHKRAAVGYGSYDPYHGNNIGGMFNRRSGGWRSNSRFNGDGINLPCANKLIIQSMTLWYILIERVFFQKVLQQYTGIS